MITVDIINVAVISILQEKQMTDQFKLFGELDMQNLEQQNLLSYLKTQAINYTSKVISSSLHIRSIETGFEIQYIQNTLNSIFLYINTPKVKQYQHQLPYSLTHKMTLQACITLLGEPTRKSKHLIECEWDNLGIGIVFAGQKWEFGDLPIEYMCVFGPRNQQIDKCAVCVSTMEIVYFTCVPCSIIKYCSEKCYNDHYFHHQIHCQQID